MSTSNLNKVSFGSLGTNVETRQGFKPDPNLYKGLCLSTITKCEIEEHEIPKQLEDGTPSAWDFAGHKTYTLIIEFKQFLGSKDKADRFVTLRETIVSSKKNTGEAVNPKVWNSLVISQYERLQHIVNALDKAGVTPKSVGIKDLDISYEDEVEVRIAKTKKFFEHFVKQIKGKEEKPKYEGIKFWLRVIAEPTRGTYYVIPAFVGKGFIEVFRTNEEPTIELGVNDSIVLKKKATTENKATSMSDPDAKAEAPAQGKSAADVLRELGIG